MKNWKGTKTEFIYENDVYTDTHGNYECHVKNNDNKIIASTFGKSVEEVRADAKLIADAGNTIQKCDKLPSELLNQRDELLKFIQNSFSLLNDSDDILDWKAGATELINRINPNK